MDPLSLTESIIAILGMTGTVGKGLQKVRQLRKAPETLLQLNNEITDLYLLVRAVDDLYRQHDDSTRVSQQEVVCAVLERTKSAVLELEKVIVYRLTKETARGSEIDLLAWVRASHKINEMKNTIRNLRSNLNAVWIEINNRNEMKRIELQLRRVYVNTKHLHPNTPEETSSLHRSEKVSCQDNSLNVLQQIRHEENDQRCSGQGLLCSTEVVPGAFTSSRVIQIHCTQGQRCKQLCDCTCHQSRRFRSPPLLDYILGSLLIGYTGLPLSQSATSCQRCLDQTVNIVYTFPYWLCRLVVLTKLRTSRNRGPELLLRCVRVRPYGSQCFQAVMRNETHHVVQSLLYEGKASVLDVDERGRSLLHIVALAFLQSSSVITFKGRIETAEHLLREGADVFQRDQCLDNPYHVILRRPPLEPSETTSRCEFLKLFEKFSIREPKDELGFHDLHSIITGLKVDTSFENKLAITPRNLVDETDGTGSTALSWAACLGNVEAVKSLLQKGADPNKVDFGGRTPLHRCYAKVDCFNALLEAGADLNHQDTNGRTILSNLLCRSDDVYLLNILNKFRLHLNLQAEDKYTALHTAVERSRPRTTQWLLQKGADVNARGPLGQTPLLTAIEGRSPDVPFEFEQLLGKTSHTIVDVHFESLLHYVARFGSIEIILAVRRVDLPGLDVESKGTRGFSFYENSAGELTAMNVAKWRRDRNADWSKMHLQSLDADPKAWFAAFESLVDLIRAEQVANIFEEFWGIVNMANMDQGSIDMTPGWKRRKTGVEQAKNPSGHTRSLLQETLRTWIQRLAAIICSLWIFLPTSLCITYKSFKPTKRDMQVLSIFALGQMVLLVGVYLIWSFMSE